MTPIEYIKSSPIYTNKMSEIWERVTGGVTGVCAVRVSGGSYGGATGVIDFGTQSSGSAASGAASSWCASHIAQYGGRCQYDCAHDGITASWL
jgi:hypothetical protein